VEKSNTPDGKNISDTLTASAKKDYGDGKWLKIDGKNVPVKYEGTAYYTGENAPTAANEVPADAKAIGTATLTFDGEGTQTATVTPTEELKPGFVTWVWKVTKNNQGDYSKYIHEDWTDGYAAANETNSFRHKAKINTAASIRTTQGGTYMVDDMWVDGLPTNHGEFTGNAEFDKDGATLKQDLLFFPKGTEVKEANKDKAEVISSTTVPAKNGFYPSICTNGFKLKEGASGTYVFVTSFEGDSRVEAYTSSVEDVTEQYTVDTPEETPTIGTTATDTKDGDKEINPTGPVSITDRVCYENLKPGKEYTLTGTLMDKTTGEAFRNEKGEDISSSTTFTAKEAKGCENVVFETTGETLKGHDTVVFENMFSDNKRIAVHAFSHRVIDSLIEAGVDDIEHGSGIDADQASEIAARGIAVTPTLRQVELFANFAAQAGTKYPVYAATMQRMYDTRVEHFQMLLDAGILLLQGTDAGGYQEHGSIAGELDLWSRWGASSQAVIDASTWVSLRYLGRRGLVEGADADLLILDDDPRADPLALARPTSVYIGGECAWQRP